MDRQNPEAPTTDLNTENATNGQNAFEVNITQEGQDRLAAQATEDQTEIQTAKSEDQNNQNTKQAQETSRIVDIVA